MKTNDPFNKNKELPFITPLGVVIGIFLLGFVVFLIYGAITAEPRGDWTDNGYTVFMFFIGSISYSILGAFAGHYLRRIIKICLSKQTFSLSYFKIPIGVLIGILLSLSGVIYCYIDTIGNTMTDWLWTVAISFMILILIIGPND